MIERILSVLLLLAWQGAMLTAPDLRQGLIGAATSIAVGLTMIVLLVAGVSDSTAPDGTDEDASFEQLAFSIPVH
ncbi:MAG: hypothetical protein J0H14_16875 [Alphaproteobacteria bacterium]|nr:hypothetical protein [Alphaproteobacteria bacterium]